jgi:hypothetical protein
MNDQMIDAEIVDLERSLRALADEDRHLQAPSHVHTAVMHRWDVSRPFAPPRHQSRRRNARLLAIGSLAAAIATVLVMYRAPSAPSPPRPVVARPVEKGHVVTPAPTVDHDARAAARWPRRPRGRGPTAAPPDEPGIVLVMDPALDLNAASLVRVRVPRATLATLGIPLVEPQRSGSVDLELIVGEDGIARMIRRAVPVASDRERTLRDEE